MKKRLLFTSVAILNTLASVAVPTVVSAETADTNSEAQAQTPMAELQNAQTKEETLSDDDTVTVEASGDSDNSEIKVDEGSAEMTGNSAEENPEILKGSKNDAPDQNIAHSEDISDLGTEEAMPEPLSRMGASAFINLAGPMAQRAAQRYGVYASVMMAQAIIESGWGGSTLAMAPNYNLFGIKGSYNGQSVYMRTKEWSPSYGWYWINAAFRKYPSYEQSFNDNGNLLRYGMGNFYRGTWKENTRSYRDATAWLQGRYATAPNYAAVLNNTIASYNLTRFDSAPQNPGTDAAAIPPLNGTAYEMSDVGIITNAKGAQLYLQADPNKPVRGTLKQGSDWELTGKAVTKNGEVYYRVSTNEYLKSSDVAVQSDSYTLQGTYEHMDDTATISNTSGAKIYYMANPDKVSKRKLGANSDWKVLGKSVLSDGQIFYQVSGKEYVSSKDVRLKSVTKVITAANKNGSAVPLASFNDDGTIGRSNRGLANNTDWLTVLNREYDGHKYYQVSTNEWIKDTYVTNIK